MLFMEPTATAYDLHFRVLGTPVRVHPMFWLVSVIMGASAGDRGLHFLLIWVICVFVSILVHELGHVWMGQAFGSHGHIVLYGFGGLAIGSNRLHRRWQRIAVCFAGPLAGFVFLGLLFVVLWFADPDAFPLYVLMAELDLGLPLNTFGALGRVLREQPNPVVFALVSDLIFINLLWGLVNLLPVWPLDGGQISRDVCEGLSPGPGLVHSLGISMAVAGLLAVHSILATTGRQLLPLSFGDLYTAILFGILALQSFQLLQQAQAQRHWMDDHWHDRD